MSAKCRSAGNSLVQKNVTISYASVGDAGVPGLLQPSRREPLAVAGAEYATSAESAAPRGQRAPTALSSLLPGRQGSLADGPQAPSGKAPDSRGLPSPNARAATHCQRPCRFAIS